MSNFSKRLSDFLSREWWKILAAFILSMLIFSISPNVSESAKIQGDDGETQAEVTKSSPAQNSKKRATHKVNESYLVPVTAVPDKESRDFDYVYEVTPKQISVTVEKEKQQDLNEVKTESIPVKGVKEDFRIDVALEKVAGVSFSPSKVTVNVKIKPKYTYSLALQKIRVLVPAEKISNKYQIEISPDTTLVELRLPNMNANTNKTFVYINLDEELRKLERQENFESKILKDVKLETINSGEAQVRSIKPAYVNVTIKKIK